MHQYVCNHRAAPAAMLRGATLVAVLSVLCWSSAPAAAPLTLQEAQRLAVARSRQLVAQSSAVTAAREMAVAAAQLPDPVASIGINNLPINGEDAWSLTRDFMTMRSVGLMQEFTRAEKREARAERYEREAEKYLADKAASVAAVRRDTALAWLDRYYAEAMQKVVAEQGQQARLEIDAAEGAYRAGRGSLADVLAARGALISLDDRASEIGRKASTARISLARWIGDDAAAPLEGTPTTDAIHLDPRTLDEDIEGHPLIGVLAKRESVAAAEVRVAQANKKTDWSVAVMYSQRGPAYSNMISVNVTVPLPWDQKNRQDREVAAKLAMLDQARAEREDMVRAHVAEVRAMLAEWESDRDRAARYVHDLVPLASGRTEATLAAYRGGKASITEVLVSRRNELDVRLQALQLEMDIARLWAQLNFLASHDDVDGASATTDSTKGRQ